MTIALALLSSLLWGASAKKCPADFSYSFTDEATGRTKKYMVLGKDLDWQDAVGTCYRHGSSLPCVESNAQNEFLGETFRDAFWVGYSRCSDGWKDSNGKDWTWSSHPSVNCPSSFKNFDSGQGIPGAEACAGMDVARFSHKRWHDYTCKAGERKMAVCECVDDTEYDELIAPPVLKNLCKDNAVLVAGTASNPWDHGGDWSDCSEAMCTSPAEHEGFDCWAGSSDEPCSCSQGTARQTGETTMHMGRRYVKYSCCGKGHHEHTGHKSEQCGDFHGHHGDVGGAIAGIMFVIFICCAGGCGVALGVACCHYQKCCCFAQQGYSTPPPVVMGAGPSYPQPQVGIATVVGQPVMAQPVGQPGVATPVMQAMPVQATVVATPVQATVVQATPAATPCEDNPNLQATSAYSNANGA